MASDRDCRADAAAYALGALDASEAEAFRRHMADCAVCHDEVSAFGGVVNALPLAAPQYKAPRRLRKRVMQGVLAEPKAVSTGAPRRPGRAFLRPRIALAGALAVAIAAAVVGLESSGGGSSTVRVIHASVIGLRGSAELRVTGGHADLIVRAFPPPPPGRIYELWLKRPGQPPAPTSALFSVTSRGSGDVGIPSNLRGVSAVMVTPEPDGGSLVPTHAPVVIAQL